MWVTGEGKRLRCPRTVTIHSARGGSLLSCATRRACDISRAIQVLICTMFRPLLPRLRSPRRLAPQPSRRRSPTPPLAVPLAALRAALRAAAPTSAPLLSLPIPRCVDKTLASATRFSMNQDLAHFALSAGILIYPIQLRCSHTSPRGQAHTGCVLRSVLLRPG